jgi:hypothetical protein
MKNFNLTGGKMQYTTTVKLIMVLATMTFLASCASGPTKSQLENADYGREMSSVECVSIAESIISSGLKDPSSAQFKHGRLFKGHWNSVPILGMGVVFGWIQQGEVNGKNSYGGYVGFKSYQVLIKDGKAVRWALRGSDGLLVPRER